MKLKIKNKTISDKTAIIIKLTICALFCILSILLIIGGIVGALLEIEEEKYLKIYIVIVDLDIVFMFGGIYSSFTMVENL